MHNKLFQPSERLRETGGVTMEGGRAMAVVWVVGECGVGSGAIRYSPGLLLAENLHEDNFYHAEKFDAFKIRRTGWWSIKHPYLLKKEAFVKKKFFR